MQAEVGVERVLGSAGFVIKVRVTGSVGMHATGNSKIAKGRETEGEGGSVSSKESGEGGARE